MELINYDPYRDAYLNLNSNDIQYLKAIPNPLLDCNSNPNYPGLELLSLMRNPKYFHWTVKTLLNVDIYPEQLVILQQSWKVPFPMWVASRGLGKSFLLAVYAWLKLILYPGHKIVGVGAAFRQSKFIFDYMKIIWDGSPVLRSMSNKNVDGPKVETDKVSMKFNGGWAAFVPIGDGQRIRGLRAHTILADEFGSLDTNIFETVIAGFAAVSASPLDNIKAAATRKKLLEEGKWSQDLEKNYQNKEINQSIITGTADYAFKHFCQYWKRYKKIIESQGDKNLLREVFNGDDAPDSFNYKDYMVIRIPFELVPEGHMDEKTIAKSKATITHSNYLCEYSACFAEDSDGFFKRSLIESCVVSTSNLINGINFDCSIIGDKDKQYVYGIDPASEKDNLTIVILELHENHTRLVYCWSTNRKEFKKKLMSGLTHTHDFYGYVVKKVRELMKSFPCAVIALDSQGGGVAIEEAFGDPDKIKTQTDELIYREINKDKPHHTDHLQGRHIIKLINFADAKWTSEANHGLKKDMEDKVLLFPKLDPILLALDFSLEANDKGDDVKTSVYDTLEDCALEIEELKNELSTIIMTSTGNGSNARDRWDTPETKSEGGKKGRMRKDRYSALVMANMVARQLSRAMAPRNFDVVGGSTSRLSGGESKGQMYQGKWANVSDACFIGVNYNR